jgi:hypothetical protein
MSDAEQLTSDMIIIDLFESLLDPSYIANNIVINKDDTLSLLPSVSVEYQLGFLYELEISINEINIERFIDTDVYYTKYINRTQKIIDISKFSRPLVCDFNDNCYFEIGRNVCKHHFEKIRKGIIEEINDKTKKRFSVLKRTYKKNDDQYSFDDMPYLESIVRLQLMMQLSNKCSKSKYPYKMEK